MHVNPVLFTNRLNTDREQSKVPTRFANLLLQILHCDRTLPDPDRLAMLSPDDWDTLTAEAIRYRLAFQVLEHLTAEPQRQALAPAACLGRLKDVVRATLMRNMRQSAEVHKILQACQSADIPVILVKGLWLTQLVYRDLKARATGDIDLLLHPQDIERFTRIAQDLGFELPGNFAQIIDLASANNEFTLVHTTQDAHLDIHWALTHPIEETPINEKELWQRSEIVSLAAIPCRSLGLEDHVLYVCFHCAGHHRFLHVGPRALLDVAHLISGPPRSIDWNDLVARARKLGWSRSAWLMFELVRENLGVQPPQTVLDALRPPDAGDREIRAAAIEAMFLDQQYEHNLSRNVVRLLDGATLHQKACTLIKRLFPPRAYVAFQFKTTVDARGFHWLYIRRWGSLLKVHLPGFVRLFTSGSATKAELKRTRVIERWLGRPDA